MEMGIEDSVVEEKWLVAVSYCRDLLRGIRPPLETAHRSMSDNA